MDKLSKQIEMDLRMRETSLQLPHIKGLWYALDGRPTTARVGDYGMRWGIKALFSDFKSRGFSITTTHLYVADRISRLILVLTIALYFGISTVMQPNEHEPKYTPKKLIEA